MTAISVCTAPPGSQEWLDERHNGIGASEVATLLKDQDGERLNPFSSPYQLWLEKTGQAEGFTGNYASHRGQHMESFVLGEYARQHPGHIVETAPDDIPSIMAHPDVPEIRCSLDALVHNRDESLVVEIKAITRRQAARWADGQVPDYYLLQVQHQLLVTGLDVAHIAVDVAGEYEERIVPRNDAVCAHLLDTVYDWWTKHVVGGEPPALDPTSKIDRALLHVRYPGEIMHPPATVGNDIAQQLRAADVAYRAADKEAKKAKQERDDIAAEIKQSMQNAIHAVDEDGYPLMKWTRIAEAVVPSYTRKSYDRTTVSQLADITEGETE